MSSKETTGGFKPKKSVALSGIEAGNTALCTVGRSGNDLNYRGYDILDIAEQCEFEEIAYLLIHGVMLAATILTLVFVPVFYAVIEQLREGRFGDEPAAANEAMRISSAAYERSSQIFLRGHFPLYCASAQLTAFGKQWQQ